VAGTRLIVVSERENCYLDLDDVNEVRIGRAPDNDIVVKDDMVSRRHAQVERDAQGALRVRDLKSFNGTYLNEQRVQDEPLRIWDFLRVGRTKMFLVSREGPPEGKQTTESSADLPLPKPDGEAGADAGGAEGTDDVEAAGGATRTMDVGDVLANKEIRGVIEEVIRKERAQVEREISRRVRDESAPSLLPSMDGVVTRARRFGPSDGGGDFYDLFSSDLHKDALQVGLGSVSGVGVAACVAASATRHTLRGITCTPSHGDPHEVVGLLREVLLRTLHPGSALSLLLARVNPTGVIQVGAVGGTGVLHYKSATEEVEVLRQPSRRDEEAQRVEAIEVTLKKGDRLLVTSDGAGALRQLGGSDPYGAERVSQRLGEHAALEPKALVAELFQDCEKFADERPDRDVTLVVIALK
jgi:serine phosphatase RsbU (regulator of sigma subunit)